MSTITIRIEGTVVTLVVDGRESVKVCGNEAEARQLYDKYKARIDAAKGS